MSGRVPRLNVWALLLAVALWIQFVLGMSVNVFVSLPSSIPGTATRTLGTKLWIALNWALANRNPWLASHAGLGVLILMISGYLLVIAYRSQNALWVVLTVAIALSLLFSLVNGLFFLLDGQQGLNSLGMATGFLLAFTLCSYGGLRMRNPEKPHQG